ncbi:hypothetical protein [Streptomyces sp. NPDC002205]|uniref:hypothetical protein n=1 Tax=Streptomyces sp. NPDC002205 TaxID=3154411 RepID=UPI003322367A
MTSQAAGGDLARAAEVSGATDRQGLLDFLSQAYYSAFHTVLRGLAVARPVLCAVVFAPLRGGRQQHAAWPAAPPERPGTREPDAHPALSARAMAEPLLDANG